MCIEKGPFPRSHKEAVSISGGPGLLKAPEPRESDGAYLMDTDVGILGVTVGEEGQSRGG